MNALLIKEDKEISLIIRYICIALLAIPNIAFFNSIFKPLTIGAVYGILSAFTNVSVANYEIIINNHRLVFIDACIAGSAYFLLAVMNLATPFKILKSRIAVLAFFFGSFFAVNISRIVLLIALLNSSIFQLVHIFLWYAAGTLMILGIWFLGVFIFKIREIPFYSDAKSLFDIIKKKRLYS
jgi:hypothetical protein